MISEEPLCAGDAWGPGSTDVERASSEECPAYIFGGSRGNEGGRFDNEAEDNLTAPLLLRNIYSM